MTQPRYQIFVSSTFRDLEDERQAILNAILKLNQFPAGMEIFPATNDTAWELIKKVIEDSDYYVLVIGGRYGSMDESGISYTEKEYDFAVSQNIPVLAFIHSDPSSISIGKSEIDPKIREKLEAFKHKVSKHHCNFWKTTEELKEKVITSLSQSIVMNPQKGWVKAGGINNTELLSRLADLQKRYDDLFAENTQLKKSVILFDSQQFAFGDEIFQFKFDFFEHEQKFEISWNDLFIDLGGDLISKKFETDLRILLPKLALKYIGKHPQNAEEMGFIENNAFIYESTLQSIRNQFLALGLIDVTELNVAGTAHPAWQLTEKGRRLYLNQKAIHRKKE